MSNTHTHHHSHAHTGPHGPHCEDELRRDVEVKREELGHTVEELASRADVKARARSKMRERKQQAEARRSELKSRALRTTQRMRSGTSAGEETPVYRPVMPPDVETSSMTDTGAYRVDQTGEGGGSRKSLIAAGGAAALAACAAGVMIRRGGHSPMGTHHMGGHHMGRRAMSGSSLSKFTVGRMGARHVGGHSTGSLGMRSMGSMGSMHPKASMGSKKGSMVSKGSKGALMAGGAMLRGRAYEVARGRLPGGHGGHGAAMMRGMALRKGAAMAGGAASPGAKAARQGVLKGSAILHATTGGGHAAASGPAHSLAHSATPEHGIVHRLDHALGRGHHHGPKGLRH